MNERLFNDNKTGYQMFASFLKKARLTSKKRKIAMVGCLVAIFTGCLVVFGISLSTFFSPELPSEVATIDSPSISPSGKYELSVLRTEEPSGVSWLLFQIRNLDNGILFVPDERFAARHTTFFLWDDDDRVWVYSGDIGTNFWILDPDGATWTKSSYDDSNISAPAYLREVRPEYHPR